MKLDSRNLRFWTSAKNLTLLLKTPGRFLIRRGGGDVASHQDEGITYVYTYLYTYICMCRCVSEYLH